MQQLQRGPLDVREWSVFLCSLCELAREFSLDVLVLKGEWSVQLGSQHTALDANPVQLNLVFEGPLVDGFALSDL